MQAAVDRRHTTLAGVTLLDLPAAHSAGQPMATTVNDKVMYLVLVAAIVADWVRRRWARLRRGVQLPRDGVVWFRSVWVLQPRGD